MISVVIPLYNKENSILNTVNSVLNQQYQDFEIIIVNDGSTDGSIRILEEIQDPRILIIHQKNSGVSLARNRGIDAAKGHFIAFLDADDEWNPEFLLTLHDLSIKFPECQVFATDYIHRDTENNLHPTIIRNLPFSGTEGILSNYFTVAASSNPPLCSISIMVSKNALLAIGGFPEGIKSGEDLLTWARLAARFKIAYSKAPLAVFNVEGYKVSEKPKRIPAERDIVGEELLKIKKEFNPEGISRYISHWHKMRSSIYMRSGLRTRSIKEAIVGLSFYPINVKLFIYIIINLLPRRIQNLLNVNKYEKN